MTTWPRGLKTRITAFDCNLFAHTAARAVIQMRFEVTQEEKTTRGVVSRVQTGEDAEEE